MVLRERREKSSGPLPEIYEIYANVRLATRGLNIFSNALFYLRKVDEFVFRTFFPKGSFFEKETRNVDKLFRKMFAFSTLLF